MNSAIIIVLAICGIVWNGFIFAQIWNLFLAPRIGVVSGIGFMCLVGVCTDFGIPDWHLWSEQEKITILIQHAFINPAGCMCIAWVASCFRQPKPKGGE